MKFASAIAAVVEYERLAQQAAAALDARKDLATKLTDAVVGELVDAFPDPAAFAKFAADMPKEPALDALVTALGPAELANLASTTLKGNTKLLGVLADKGCGRDPAKLKAFADAFKADPKELHAMLDEAGFGTQPEAMAAVLQGGCDGDPVKLKTVFAKFTTKPEREKLAGVLAGGGLGQAPGALGALAKHGDGALLKQFSTDFTGANPTETEQQQGKLRGLLGQAGCDGGAPGRPGLLTDVVTKGLGGSPARLIELHDAFDDGAAMQRLPDLGRLLSGLDGLDALDGTNRQAGERLAGLIAAFKSRDGALTDANAAKKLRAPFLDKITTLSVAGQTPRYGGPEGAQSGAKVAANRAAPPPAQQAATLAAGITNDASLGLITASLTDPAARTQASSAAGQVAGLSARADELAKAPVAGDPAQTERTQLAIKAAQDAVAAIGKRVDGGSAAEIEALATIGVAALDAAALEPDAATRADALAAAKAAEKAVLDALKRLAATLLSGAPGAGAASAAQAALAGLPAAASAGVKAAVKLVATIATRACAISQGAMADPAVASTAAKKAIEDGHSAAERAGKELEAKNQAQATAAAATAMSKQVETAPRPVDPGVLGRANDAAAAAVAAGERCPDQATAKAAFDAAKALLAEVGTAVRDAASRVELAAAQGTTAGAAALVAAADVDRVQALPGGAFQPAAADQLNRGGTAARMAALTGADAETLGSADKAVLKKAAEDVAYRTAATQKGGAPDPADVTNAATTGNNAADLAAVAAAQAALAVTAATVATDPAAYIVLLETAGTQAEAALMAARGATDDGKRDAALKAAKDAAAAAAAGAALLAKHHQAQATTELGTKRNAKIVTAAAQRDVLALAAIPASAGVAAAAQAAFDDGKLAIGNAAAAQLSSLAETDVAVRTATKNAAGKQIEARLPGATQAAKLNALVAARDAAKALADAAVARLTAASGALPTAINPTLLANCKDAITAAKAAHGAAAAWHDASKKVEQALVAYEKELGAVANPTAEEAGVLATIVGQKNAAKAQTTAAKTLLDLPSPPTPPPAGLPPPAHPLGTPFWDMNKRLRGATEAANKTVGGAPAGTADLQNATGFMGSLCQDAKEVSQTDSDLMRVGPSLVKQPYTGTPEPGVSIGGQNVAIDMAHITDRHVRKTYKFTPESSPLGSQHDIGTLLDAKLVGIGKTPTETALIKEGKSNKANSFFPETVDAAAAQALAEQAMGLVTNPPHPPQTLANYLYTQIALQTTGPIADRWKKVFLQQVVNVSVPPALSCTIGINIASNPGTATTATPRARMFYPNEGDMLSMSDVLIQAKALGVNQ